MHSPLVHISPREPLPLTISFECKFSSSFNSSKILVSSKIPSQTRKYFWRHHFLSTWLSLAGTRDLKDRSKRRPKTVLILYFLTLNGCIYTYISRTEISCQTCKWRDIDPALRLEVVLSITDPLCKQWNSDFISSQHIVAADAIYVIVYKITLWYEQTCLEVPRMNRNNKYQYMAVSVAMIWKNQDPL